MEQAAEILPDTPLESNGSEHMAMKQAAEVSQNEALPAGSMMNTFLDQAAEVSPNESSLTGSTMNTFLEQAAEVSPNESSLTGSTMNTFLEQAAEALWKEYHDGISDIKLVFPGRRARLFFGEALSRHLDKPLWQPESISIDDLVWELSSMQSVEKLRLVAELHKVYSKYHDEPFDKFYGWGLMLLQDFDTIDKYMVNAREIFTNISDLRDVDLKFELASSELEIVKDFWRSFSSKKAQSQQQSTFLLIWRSLADIYKEFKERLTTLGIAYPGMAYRIVADGMKDIYVESNKYCFIGFNALNECEQKILKFLRDKGDALFMWDYSELYVKDMKQEAGKFIRRNLAKFPQSFPLDTGYNKDLKISVISSPTDVLQCKAVAKELEEIYKRQGFVDKETAIVLTDENLLEVALNFIPECVERLNITMGYPVVSTVAYNYLERLLQLQIRKRDNKFYHKDVKELLSHPYVAELEPRKAKKLRDKLNAEQLIYIDAENLHDFRFVFTPINEVPDLQNYLLKALSAISATDDAERREYIYTLIASVAELAATIQNCDIKLSVPMYISLLKQMLIQVRIPYTGEPLGGLQILGILETRNLDFKNVIMLSVTDDNFPGNRGGQSYIPYNLRKAFGLPTVADAEAMYAYYFYRLIQRAENLTMIYTSAADEKTTGEQSRYIYQLEYESEFEVTRKNIALSITPPSQKDIIIEKSPEIIAKLKAKAFAPSTINRYLTCAMRFYFRDIARIRPPEELDEEFSKLNLGNALHRAMELLYTPLVGKANPQELISKISDQDVKNIVDDVLIEIAKEVATEKGAQLQIGRDMLEMYINQILRYDSQRPDVYIIDRLEHKSEVVIDGVKLMGTADRIDRLSDGSIAIVDYKSGGGDQLEFSSVEELFDTNKAKRNGAALQTLIYAQMYFESEHIDVLPMLYISRLMNAEQFSPLLKIKFEALTHLSVEFRVLVQDGLRELMGQLLDSAVPFVQNRANRNCEFCDYNSLCNY